jgi:glycogen debranching enzyme
MLHDPEHLWSPYGIRSLSASHSEFGQGENYWKGPIWIQMNYLALGALYKVSDRTCLFIYADKGRWKDLCQGRRAISS